MPSPVIAAPPYPAASTRSSDALPRSGDLAWLVRLRWWSASGQILALLVASQGAVQSLPPLPVLLAAAVTLLTNVAARALRHTDRAHTITVLLLLFDATLLGTLLYFTGGAANPLSILFLVHIALAAVMLPAGWAWGLTGFSVLAFGLLFFAPSLPTSEDPHAAHHGAAHGHPHAHAAPDTGPANNDAFHMHLRAMWLGFSLAAVLIAYFVTRVSASLRAREQQLAHTRERAQRAERVAALASLAAGTAHELGTPLASISLAAGEMQRALEQLPARDVLREDVTLIQEQARRCRTILDVMSQKAGQNVGEAPVRIVADRLVALAIEQVSDADQRRIDVTLTPAEVTGSAAGALRLPPQVVSQGIANLLRNALAASTQGQRVELDVRIDDSWIWLAVKDVGEGMSPQFLQQAMDPFVTTRQQLGGMGLGLFVTRATVERLGGSLRLESTPGRGTTATLKLPVDVVTYLQASHA